MYLPSTLIFRHCGLPRSVFCVFRGILAVPLTFLSDFKETWIFSTDFSKNFSNIEFDENPSLWGPVVPCGLAYRRTDMMMPVGACCYFAKSAHNLYVLPTCCLTLILLTWRTWWAPNNTSKWQMGFNLAFKGLSHAYNSWNKQYIYIYIYIYIELTARSL